MLKLTKFEKARIVGARALQLSMGAPPIIKVTEDEISPLRIAIKELEKEVIPITIRRNMPAKKEHGE